jgi:hypothetical protein
VIELIATAFAKVGKEGVITVEEAKGQTLYGCCGRNAVEGISIFRYQLKRWKWN